jgi:dipeptidyl aminopeptidase/acylaminoacyl peptidase
MARNDANRWAAGLAVALACALLAAHAAAQTKRPMTAEDLWAAKRPGAPSLSPDGRWAAVSVVSYEMEKNSGASDIWLLATDPAAGPPRQLTTHPASDSAPAWSPDGKWIAFLSRREGDDQAQIYLISPAGGEPRRLTKVATGASGMKWLADSRRIAFISWVWPDLKTDEEQAKRQKERAESKVKAYILDTTNFRYWDRWVADGRVPHVFVADVETGQHRDLLAGTGLSLPRTEPGASSYDFSPDGAELALVTDLGPDPGYMPNSDVALLDVGSGRWTNLTADNKSDDGSPRYSPDGKWLAYTRSLIPYAPDRQRLMLYDRAAKTKRALAENWDRSVAEFVWAPDSQGFYFIAEDRARAPVWTLALAGGSEPKRLIEGGTNASLGVSGDGKTLAFVRTTMAMPPAVFAAASSGAGARKIETFNDALAAQWDLGEVRDVNYKGWGGEAVQMWVVYPPGFDRAKKWPLLQVVHGGPHGAWMDQFHFRWNMHLFASRGYVVAAVNFHGSPGWGDAFTDSIHGRYGTKELEDVEKGTDFLIAEGYIDAERLAAAGGSYGGYMVAWMNGHTQRYKAYVCHAGVYDWVAQMASDFVRGRQRALGGFPWESPEKVLEQSAHTYAKNFKTPTLVVHGEIDYRVPLTQGLQYYTTLRMLDVPARLVYFPDENHWVLKPQNSRLWYREFFDWVGKYAPAGGR